LNTELASARAEVWSSEVIPKSAVSPTITINRSAASASADAAALNIDSANRSVG
jgi:hypothetical protein